MMHIHIEYKFGKNREILILKGQRECDGIWEYSLIVRIHNVRYSSYKVMHIWTPSRARVYEEALMWLECLTCTVNL